jgi:hypothetical protein
LNITASRASHWEAFLFADGSPDSWILTDILRLQNPRRADDLSRICRVFPGMNESGKAVHFERAFVTGF